MSTREGKHGLEAHAEAQGRALQRMADDERDQVKQLGDRIGFGRTIQLAEQLWGEMLPGGTDPSSNFRRSLEAEVERLRAENAELRAVAIDPLEAQARAIAADQNVHRILQLEANKQHSGRNYRGAQGQAGVVRGAGIAVRQVDRVLCVRPSGVGDAQPQAMSDDLHLPKVDMSRWSLPAINVRLTFTPDYRAVRMLVTTQVKQVESGEMGPVLHDARLDISHASNRDAMRIFIETTLLHVLRHELGECLYVDGERVRDPHPKPG